MKKNLFIAFEGIDGSGKSTQLRLLAERLSGEGISVRTTVEPTPGRIGSIIRDAFNGRYTADDRTIAGLFVADRLEHLLDPERGILAMLEQGHTVITDRYCFSSYAYQGVHVPLDWVITANSLATGLRRADLTVFIDITPETAMERLALGRDSRERYETLENLTLVRNLYFESFHRAGTGERIFITDGNRPADVVAADIYREIQSL